MSVRLRYYRYHSIQEDEYDDVETAIGAAFWMEENGTAAPDAVLAEDGTVLVAPEEIAKRMDAYYESTWGKASR